MTGTGTKINLFSQIPASACFNTFLRIRKDFFRHSVRADRPCCYVTHSLEGMRSKGLVQLGAAFHWLLTGANSLPSLLLPISCHIPLIDIVFYCGLTLQHTVEHDEQGLSNYAMCAINPSHIGKTFNDAALHEIVNTISNSTLPRKNLPYQ
jgi:hypothetical protein